MPFEQFDRSRLMLLPLSERVHDLDLSVMVNPEEKPEYHHDTITLLAQRVRAAREKGASVLMMMGGHVVRAGVVSIPVTFSVSAKWLKILTEFKQQEKITVGYFDTETLAVKTAEMYVEGYKASLVKDTSRKGLWTVSFTLREF